MLTRQTISLCRSGMDYSPPPELTWLRGSLRQWQSKAFSALGEVCGLLDGIPSLEHAGASVTDWGNSTGFLRHGKLHAFPRYRFAENTQLSPSLTQKPGNTSTSFDLTVLTFRGRICPVKKLK